MKRCSGWIAAMILNGFLFPVTGQEISHQIMLSPAAFDPLEGVPAVSLTLVADPAGQLFIVQFTTQPLEEFRQEIGTLGGTIYGYLHNNSHIVKMNEATRGQVAALPYVRWVGPYHPAYRLEAFLRDNLDQAETLFPLQVYNIAVFESGLAQKNVVAQRIAQIGGIIEVVSKNGFLLFARLTPQQLLSVIQWDEVAFVDRWGPPGLSMNIARNKSISGANYVEGVADYLGLRVRGEIMDSHLDTEHVAFQSILDVREPPILHGAQIVNDMHGTWVYGCAFGDGTEAGVAGAKGVIPHAQGIFAAYCRLEEAAADGTTSGPNCRAENIPTVDRYCHTCELVSSDCCSVCCSTCPCPSEEYTPIPSLNAVFQSNSWGTNADTTYNNMSKLMDDILFQYDLLVCQSQDNQGTTISKYEAWAKNIVSVGGVHHFDTLNKGDDRWKFEGAAASIGPASDGRIKPDFTHFFDNVYTTQKGSPNYTPSPGFGGTSAATPITCGHFGLFFEMWADAIFGNTLLDPNCNPAVENCVFKNRPHMTTAKAMMINTASPYPFVGSAESVDLTRTHQGWGLVQVGRLHILRSRFPIIVDETRILTQVSNTAEYTVTVPANTHALRATLVYADPPGNPAFQIRHTFNDLDLRVTAPNGTTRYWGNCGLREGNWSSSVCTISNRPFPNDPCIQYPNIPCTQVFDTVENVFVQSPVSGTWSVRITAPSIIADGHLETPVVNDVDFALVVSIDPDCNGNGKSDADDILDSSPAGSPDCNSNSSPDSCDISTGLSCDGNTDGIPDECQIPLLVNGACCLSYTPGDCIFTTKCACDQQGVWFFGVGSRCTSVNCLTAPQ